MQTGRQLLPDPPRYERHRVLTWAQRLARVFRIDVTARGGAELHGPARGRLNHLATHGIPVLRRMRISLPVIECYRCLPGSIWP